MPKFVTTAVVLVVLLISSRPAYAYLDPAAGSLLLQLAVAGVAGLAVIAKLYWRKVRSFFGKEYPEQEGLEDEDGESAR